MLDDLRQVAREEDEDDFALGSYDDIVEEYDDGKLFGMTAVERMFLSVGLFLITLVFSIILLVVTDSIAV